MPFNKVLEATLSVRNSRLSGNRQRLQFCQIKFRLQAKTTVCTNLTCEAIFSRQRLVNVRLRLQVHVFRCDGMPLLLIVAHHLFSQGSAPACFFTGLAVQGTGDDVDGI